MVTDGEEQLAEAAERRPPSFLGEFWRFIRDNRTWWLTPVLLILLLVAAFVLLTTTAVGPFIYPLF